MISIIFNGPPGSGKDEAAKTIREFDPTNTVHLEFKTQLIEHALDLFEIDRDLFMSLYNDRNTKEERSIHLTLDGKTLYSPREALIYTSEVVYKPRYGKGYFGECAARLLQDGKINVFSDGGFVEEIIPVANRCQNRLAIVHLYREGCSFKSDSRSYVHIEDVLQYTIINNHGLELFQSSVINIYNQIRHLFQGSKL